MSILVKGIDMPKRCIECPLCQHISLVNSPRLVYACAKGMRPMLVHETAEGVDKFCKMQKPDWCPLVEVPTPHGRLIDHKKLEKDLEKRWNVNDDQDFCNKEVWHALEEAQTVIEAEK